ncbi:hypothetical protein DSO57_1016274 [Entomophthora muscae]|uniref:Uncharacterized protein n=1 Tax=Entomophthora muscae TaxID=34485 RepID=A0ACC2SHK9_9FUNG|nr:hypothetical protein DSO57_1016274 [Entomophthora muscae]
MQMKPQFLNWGGWNPITVTNWLHTNHLTYSEIHKYIHPAICPESAIAWKTKGFTPAEAKKWASIEAPIDLAISLRDIKIHPSMIADFLTEGYSMDEAIEYNIKRIPLKEAPLPKKEGIKVNMSYSERVRMGLETKLNKDGFIPFDDFLREHTAQGNPYKCTPRSSLNHAIRIHVNNLTKGSIKQCKDSICKALDDRFPESQLDSHWAVSEGYLDIGFESAELRNEALDLEIYCNESPLKIEPTRYSKQRAKWVTFTNLPTNKDRHWVQEAVVTGLSYYRDILETMIEGADRAKCMRPKTIHVLLDMAPIVKSRGKPIPRFIRPPGCLNTVTYVEPESERPVCRFCYQMGHTAYHCSHRKSAHFSEIEHDEESGVTKVKSKTFLPTQTKVVATTRSHRYTGHESNTTKNGRKT